MKKLLSLAVLTAPLLLAACGTTTEADATATPVNPNGAVVNFVPSEFDTNPYLERVLATSGEHTIYGREFVYSLRNNMAQDEQMFTWLAQMMGEDPEEAIAAHWAEIGEDGYTNLELLHQATLAQTKDRAIMLILAREAGMSYDADLHALIMADLQAQIAELEAEGIDAHELFYTLFGITIEQYYYLEQERLLGMAFIDYLTDAVEVSEADIEAFVAEQLPSATLEAGAYHVLVRDTAQAEDILARLNAGEDIQALAAAYSEDPGVQRPEGAFYSFPRGVMVPEFEAFAFDNPAGTTGIVETTHGYHIMLTAGVTEITHEISEAELEAAREHARINLASDVAFDNLLAMIEARPMEWSVDEAVLAQLN